MPAFVEDMLDRFARKVGFALTSFVVDAFPIRAPAVTPYLIRSFRYEFEGCAALVMVRGGREASRGSELCEHLERAGYEVWVDAGDHVIFRRWLAGARKRTNELEILRQLGSKGRGANWPTRSTTARPERSRPRGWRRAIQEAYAARVPWSESTVGFSRELLLTRRKRLALLVSVFGTCPRRGNPWIDISVDLFDKS